MLRRPCPHASGWTIKKGKFAAMVRPAEEKVRIAAPMYQGQPTTLLGRCMYLAVACLRLLIALLAPCTGSTGGAPSSAVLNLLVKACGPAVQGHSML